MNLTNHDEFEQRGSLHSGEDGALKAEKSGEGHENKRKYGDDVSLTRKDVAQSEEDNAREEKKRRKNDKKEKKRKEKKREKKSSKKSKKKKKKKAASSSCSSSDSDSEEASAAAASSAARSFLQEQLAKLDAKRVQKPPPGALPPTEEKRLSFMGSVMPSYSTGRVETGVLSSQSGSYKGWKRHQEGSPHVVL